MVIDIPQRITRLAPLTDALARIDAQVAAVTPRDAKIKNALGLVLAEDVVASARMPEKPTALRDGFAVHSEWTQNASSYAPAPLAQIPARVDAGDMLPGGTDAIAPFDSVVLHDARAEIVNPVTPGDGVILAGTNAAAGEPLRRAGERLRASDIAVLDALGIERLRVREPRLHIVHTGAPNDAVAAAATLIASAARNAGAVITVGEMKMDADSSGTALGHANIDAVIGIGGTGTGRNDASVQILARAGRLDFHGVGLMPGETSAFGAAAGHPVLLLPGRPDAALAGWLVLGRRLLARLSGTLEEDRPHNAILSRKIASTVGIAEIVPVRLTGNEAEPLATTVLPLRTLAQADGWIMVPAASEGYAAGTAVAVRPLP